MAEPTPFPGLSAVADRYDVLLCDVWGVIHNGVRAHAGIVEALTGFRRHGKVVLITNAPRPSGPVADQLARFGVPADAYDAIVSSGDVVREHLVAEGFCRVHHIGPDRDLPLYEGTDMRLASEDDADVVVVAGLEDDRREAPEDYRRRLARLAARGLPFVCANPDIVVEVGGDLFYCAGALAELYEEVGGTVRHFGKPHWPIYDTALGAAGVAEPRVLVVGDGLPTDITGANRHGYDVVFVTGGIHDHELGEPGAPDPDKVATRLADEALSATHFAPRLTW